MSFKGSFSYPLRLRRKDDRLSKTIWAKMVHRRQLSIRLTVCWWDGETWTIHTRQKATWDQHKWVSLLLLPNWLKAAVWKRLSLSCPGSWSMYLATPNFQVRPGCLRRWWRTARLQHPWINDVLGALHGCELFLNLSSMLASCPHWVSVAMTLLSQHSTVDIALNTKGWIQAGIWSYPI